LWHRIWTASRRRLSASLPLGGAGRWFTASARDPLLILTVLAREDERFGLVTTASTTFTEPYDLAFQ
jgi:alkanesulfonate monooxygenase SsuD/methylene tetrahydromethanopterin reductase-like flavin-dependent oxidoreductase (luciferase family)